MTLRQLFQGVSDNPGWLIYYFTAVPAVCLVLLLLTNGVDQAIKIKWVFSALCFMVVIPGIFALTLNLYTFLFERQSVWDMNMVVQALPILSMFLSLFLVKKALPFEHIPGFEKLTGIFTIIFAVMGIMWFIDKTHIYAFTSIPFSYIAIGFVAILLLIKFGASRVF